ncbi:unnamed protein product [Rotaria sp. Silwood1]|nr:unnamed protein product [Rotaria sp. Silwood1]
MYKENKHNIFFETAKFGHRTFCLIGKLQLYIDNVLTKLELLEKGKMKRREALTRILNSISEDDKLSKEMKHERLEKMIRDELEETNLDRQTPIQNLNQKTKTSGAPGSGHSH